MQVYVNVQLRFFQHEVYFTSSEKILRVDHHHNYRLTGLAMGDTSLINCTNGGY